MTSASRRKGWRASSRRALVLGLAVLGSAVAVPASAVAAPGDYTQQQVNDAIAHGVAYLDTQAQPDGSFGTWWPVGATGLALVSYGVLDDGKYANLSAGEQDVVRNAVAYLLSQQHPDGSFGGMAVYETSTTLMALSYMSDVPTTPAGAVADAVAKGRDFLTKTQNAPPNEPCQSDGADGSGLGGQSYCGGWGYSGLSNSWSDQSNTGFAMTALELTGGVPQAVAQANIGWQRNVQNWKATNPVFAMWNDGGGFYKPGWTDLDYTSNGNNTGSLLFGLGYDGVAGDDPSVVAALAFGKDVLDEYELMKAQDPSVRRGVSHTGTTLDGTCVIATPDCTWRYISQGHGGYHYSMFALSKGIGHFLPADLGDPDNYYAKIVDLLLSEQRTDSETAGSWPDDGEFDGEHPVIATGLAILALGRVGQPATVEGTVYADANGNGQRDVGEQGAAGWTVYIDADDSGSYDAAKDVSAVTAADGSYEIQQIPAGTHDVRIVAKDGYACTAPKDCRYAAQAFKTDVKLTGLDFGEYQVQPASTTTTPPPVSGAGQPVVILPPCASRRSVLVHVTPRWAHRVVKVLAQTGSSPLKVQRSGDGWLVHLKGLAKGRYVIRFTVVLKGGHRIHDTRTWRTCSPTLQGSAPAIGGRHH